LDHGLTQREIECVRLAGQRLSDKEIAQHLRISPKTVQNHLASAFQKLRVTSRRDAAALLGELHPVSPIPMAATAELVADASANGTAQSRDDGERNRPATLYAWYAGLGRWRTPPRWPGGRLLLIATIAALALILMGGAMGLLRIVFEVVEILRSR